VRSWDGIKRFSSSLSAVSGQTVNQRLILRNRDYFTNAPCNVKNRPITAGGQWVNFGGVEFEKSFGMMVARDGVELPTPAFSELRC
jgi:hypothetical protein